MFRYALERLSVGVEPVVPLTMKDIRNTLGPGYEVGWYGWDTLSGRKTNCRLPPRKIRILEEDYSKIRRLMKDGSSFEDFGKELDWPLHGRLHNYISEECLTNNNGQDSGVMCCSEVSARDPIFYRWHSFMEDLVQEFRDINYRK